MHLEDFIKFILSIIKFILYILVGIIAVGFLIGLIIFICIIIRIGV